jgi:hypothetical protein
MLNKNLNAIKIALIAFFVFLFYRTKQSDKIDKNNDMSNIFTENDAKEALIKLSKINYDNAKIIERIYRWETAHFKSRQFQLTGSAGMEVGKWLNIPSNVKSVELIENGTGLKKKFIVWRSCYDFVLYLNDYIKRHNGNWSRWYSTNPDLQTKYRNNVNLVKNRFIL